MPVLKKCSGGDAAAARCATRRNPRNDHATPITPYIPRSDGRHGAGGPMLGGGLGLGPPTRA